MTLEFEPLNLPTHPVEATGFFNGYVQCLRDILQLVKGYQPNQIDGDDFEDLLERMIDTTLTTKSRSGSE